jgi:hypothetical protein
MLLISEANMTAGRQAGRRRDDDESPSFLMQADKEDGMLRSWHTALVLTGAMTVSIRAECNESISKADLLHGTNPQPTYKLTVDLHASKPCERVVFR